MRLSIRLAAGTASEKTDLLSLLRTVTGVLLRIFK